MLTGECARYLVDFMEENATLRRFATLCWGPDEFLFATVIMNSPFRASVINNNYRYMDWSLGGANPKLLTMEDFGSLRSSDMLFARKFDMVVDSEVLDKIDTLIKQKPDGVAEAL